MWMGLEWMDGMGITGHLFSKSTFGANKFPLKNWQEKLINYAEWHQRVKYAKPDFEENAKKLNV